MTSIPATSKGPIQLHYSGGQVIVTPEDEDRFVLASRQAVSACQSAFVFERAINQFKSEFLDRLHKWCLEHKSSVRACYVPFPSSGCAIKVFMVARSGEFDFELSDLIAGLEIDCESAGWSCDILQIATGSPDELQVFFDPDQSLQVFDDGNGTTT